MSNTLLIELLTEELPPKALKRLSEAFANVFTASLVAQGFVNDNATPTVFATPRRVAFTLPHVAEKSADKPERMKVLPVAIAFDADGKATTPLLRKLASMNLGEDDIKDLQRAPDGKAESLFFDRMIPGVSLAEGAQIALDEAVTKLPIPKVMRYAAHNGYYNDVSFVRPAHRLVALFGADVLPLKALGLTAGRETLGHRFMCATPALTLDNAEDYEKKLADDGKVVASFAKRRQTIEELLKANAQHDESGADDNVVAPDALLDEVTSLVEFPVVYRGTFDEAFLEVPQECLILTMQQNQKYFALKDDNNKLLPRFLLVSNIATDNPVAIINGNERVMRPRLADARFFFQQDCKATLASRVDKLKTNIYFKGLGTQFDRMERVRHIAGALTVSLFPKGSEILAHAKTIERIAMLAKADLTTDMVGEFPELQGIMGRYYAQHDGEPQVVCDGIEQHYLPRFAGDALPQTTEATAASLADKLEAIVGMFAIGQIPTGDRDPFGLRRAAIGILRMLIEKKLALPLSSAIELAKLGFKHADIHITDKKGATVAIDWDAVTTTLQDFFIDRLRNILKDDGATAQQTEALLTYVRARFADKHDDLGSLPDRLAALKSFEGLAEAQALAAANKRIVNILKKTDETATAPVDETLFKEDAERDLFALFQKTITPTVDAAMQKGDYSTALKELAGARFAIDTFFDKVMVMDEDPKVRQNRLALLASLRQTMNQVAEIAALAL
jgi:glycyl-tRNA synthetase beta chain